MQPFGLYGQSTFKSFKTTVSHTFHNEMIAIINLAVGFHLILRWGTRLFWFTLTKWKSRIGLLPFKCFLVVRLLRSVIRCRALFVLSFLQFFCFFRYFFFSCCVGYSTSHTSQEIASYWGRGARCNYRTAVVSACLWGLTEGGHCFALPLWKRLLLPLVQTTRVRAKKKKQSGRGV